MLRSVKCKVSGISTVLDILISSENMKIKNIIFSLFGVGQAKKQADTEGKASSFPEDIQRKVRELFPDEADQVYILQKLGTLWQMPLNVGPDQLARGILILSGSSRNEFDALFEGDFMGDPRDLLVSAEEKLGNPGHYCTEPFGPNAIER